ncbi:short-chain dehydrogenase [Ephemerocybe angulata]|uniref:Short-chain dehydrogenase n=1 Tax=Ephemerocybe angulata TaxID=980116 RepID=A0A8H6IFD4_9AGAR|nr:short-chain dehydrogenase [Tulosesus angulatus]
MKKGFSDAIKDQYTKVPPVATADLTGKTVVVVGANTGLGFEATKHFARMNPGKLILACRSEERGSAAVKKLKSETSYDKAELWIVDLGKFSSVVAFTDRFEKSGERLDILVANAAMASYEYKTTSDGWEESLQVNALSLSLMSLLLTPRMVETGVKYATKPRIVIVSSDLHYMIGTNLEDVYEAKSPFRLLNSPEHCTQKLLNSGDRYSETKLLNVFFAQSLAELLKDTPVIVNSLNPGYCYSELRRSFSGVKAMVDCLMEKVLAHTTEAGSRSLVYAAVGGAEDPEKLRGAYLNINTPTEPADAVIGEEGRKRQDKLWADLIAELSKVDRRIPSIIKQLS